MPFNEGQRQTLLALGHESIERGLMERTLPAWSDARLQPGLDVPRASFVTLEHAGALRGCCGTLVATRAVGEDVWRNAWASAFADPRFPPLVRPELSQIELHVSVLSPLEPMEVDGERDLLLQLRPHVDGLVLELDASRATFLPAVWKQLPEPDRFVAHLKQKAGWPRGFWSGRIRAYRYTTESFGEHEAGTEDPAQRSGAGRA